MNKPSNAAEVLAQVIEVKSVSVRKGCGLEESDLARINNMLQSGRWIILAVTTGGPLTTIPAVTFYDLGRIKEEPIMSP